MASNGIICQDVLSKARLKIDECHVTEVKAQVQRQRPAASHSNQEVPTHHAIITLYNKKPILHSQQCSKLNADGDHLSWLTDEFNFIITTNDVLQVSNEFEYFKINY